MTDTEAEKYVKLIYYVMKDYPNYPNKEDLYQAGWVGLVTAELLYDSSRNTKFSTYAYPFVKGEMTRLIEKDKPIKISNELMKLNLKYQKMKILLSQQLMREPTITEMANYLEVSENELIEAIHATQPIKSIHYSIQSDTKELLLEDIIPSYKEDIDQKLDLEQAITSLSQQDKKILTFHMTKNQQEIGEMLNMSQVKVSRQLTKIRKEILSKVA